MNSTQNNKDPDLYSPHDVITLMHQVEQEEGSIDNLFRNKNKYKLLLEMYDSLPFVISLSNLWKRKLLILPSDSPDLWLIDNENQERLLVELTEVSPYENLHTEDLYTELAEKIWKTKKDKRYENAGEVHLLITLKKNLQKFEVSRLADAIQQYEWIYQRIWFQVQNQDSKCQLYDLYPHKYHVLEPVEYNHVKDVNQMYWYSQASISISTLVSEIA